MKLVSASHRLIPYGLIVLSIVPIIAGAVRVQQLGSGVEVTAENMRFLANPSTVIVHITAATVFCLLGAFQFDPDFRRHHPRWHRQAGRGLVALGLVSAATGLVLSHLRPGASFSGTAPANFDGTSLYLIRLIVGLAMILSLCRGLAAIWRRDFQSHAAWMIRGYALGLGAGTQVFTHLPWFLWPALRGELTRTLCMGAGWLINLAVGEWIIRRGARPGPRAGASRATGAPA